MEKKKPALDIGDFIWGILILGNVRKKSPELSEKCDVG